MENKRNICSGVQIFELLGGKWKLPIIWIISQNEGIRYNELKRQLSGVTNTSLTRALKNLEKKKLIFRKDFEENPPRIEYYLTEYSRPIIPSICFIADWGKEFLDVEK